MRFREKRQEELGIDLTPFIDVVFMLLLFFVVSASLFKKPTQLGVALPKANTEALANENNTIEIGIDAQGAYYINGISMRSKEPKKLKAVLASKLKEKGSLSLVLAGDKMAPHQAVVSTLEVAQQLGITQVRIIAEQHSAS